MINRITALLLFILLLPLMLILAAVSFFVYGRALFYHSGRLGLHKQPFIMLKYRTMQRWPEEKISRYLSEHPEKKALWEEQRKIEHDPRISVWGLFLRRFSLDELPQLLNVIRGEMNLAGPRPITADEEKRYGKYSSFLHSVKPGMTGLWQVSGRNLVSFHRRIAINLYYIRHRTWKMDLWILWKTIGTVLSGRGCF